MHPFLFLLFLLCTVDCFAAGSALTPEQTISRYIQHDLNGDRLNSETRAMSIGPLVSWLEEPGWDVAVVVESSRVQPVQRAADGLRAMVTYRLLGEIAAGEWRPLRKAPNLQQVAFLIDRIEGRWRLVRPLIPPHISLSTAIRLLEADAALYQSPRQQKVLQDSLRQLRRLKEERS